MDEKRVLLIELGKNRGVLTGQQIRTIRGQLFAGDVEGAKKGLDRLLEKYSLKTTGGYKKC